MLDILPTELVDCITLYLTLQQLKPLRLVCRRLNQKTLDDFERRCGFSTQSTDLQKATYLRQSLGYPFDYSENEDDSQKEIIVELLPGQTGTKTVYDKFKNIVPTALTLAAYLRGPLFRTENVIIKRNVDPKIYDEHHEPTHDSLAEQEMADLIDSLRLFFDVCFIRQRLPVRIFDLQSEVWYESIELTLSLELVHPTMIQVNDHPLSLLTKFCVSSGLTSMIDGSPNAPMNAWFSSIAQLAPKLSRVEEKHTRSFAAKKAITDVDSLGGAHHHHFTLHNLQHGYLYSFETLRISPRSLLPSTLTRLEINEVTFNSLEDWWTFFDAIKEQGRHLKCIKLVDLLIISPMTGWIVTREILGLSTDKIQPSQFKYISTWWQSSDAASLPSWRDRPSKDHFLSIGHGRPTTFQERCEASVDGPFHGGVAYEGNHAQIALDAIMKSMYIGWLCWNRRYGTDFVGSRYS